MTVNTSWEDALARIGSGTIHLLYTDPPFGMAYQSRIPGSRPWNSNGKSSRRFASPMRGDKKRDRINWSRFATEAFRVLRRNSFLVLHTNVPLLAQITGIFTAKGFRYKGVIVWTKGSAIGGHLEGTLKRDWEPLLYMSKGNPRVNPIAVERRGERVMRDRISETADWNFTLKEKEKAGHPTQKPLELAKQVVRLMSKRGDTVLDCFAGSGTIALACRELGRKCISVEADPFMRDLIERRLKPEERRTVPNARLRRLREKAGLSLARLAEIAGTTPQAIQMLESGANREPSVVKGLRIARALGVTDSEEIERLFSPAGD